MQKAIALKDRHSKGDLRYYSNYQPDYLYVTLHKDWCEEVIDAPFEDTTLMIPKGWDPVLKEVYGGLYAASAGRKTCSNPFQFTDTGIRLMNNAAENNTQKNNNA